MRYLLFKRPNNYNTQSPAQIYLFLLLLYVVVYFSFDNVTRRIRITTMTTHTT